MEVAHDGNVKTPLRKAFDYMRHGGSGVLVVDGDANDLRPGQGQGRNLLDGARNVGRVGVGHGLHDHRNLPADANVTNLDRGCFPALNLRHSSILPILAVRGNSMPSALSPKNAIQPATAHPQVFKEMR